MVSSLRAALGCLGLDASGKFSVLPDLLCFWQGRVPADPDPAVTARVSVLSFLNALKGSHIHLNVITIGDDTFTSDEFDKIDFAIYRAREIYAQVGLGVGRVEYYFVNAADAGGKDDIGSEAEAEDLMNDWAVQNDGVDVFIVKSISATNLLGKSPVGGPCDKSKGGQTGALGGGVDRDPDGLARTFAHEIGHFLSLEHNHADGQCPAAAADSLNLMSQTRCPQDNGQSLRDAVVLTGGQGSAMLGHCSVRGGCP